MSFCEGLASWEADGAHADAAYTGNGSEVTGPQKEQFKESEFLEG